MEQLLQGHYRAFSVKTQQELNAAIGRYRELYAQLPVYAITRYPSGFQLPEGVCVIENPWPSTGVWWLGKDPLPSTIAFREDEAKQKAMISVSTSEMVEVPTLKRTKGRPATRIKCPFCRMLCAPEELGHWAGWMEGKEPTYWSQLRLYVFTRDGFRCGGCHNKFPPEQLVAHHITPKELGGEDNARNLRTYCLTCHP